MDPSLRSARGFPKGRFCAANENREMEAVESNGSRESKLEIARAICFDRLAGLMSTGLWNRRGSMNYSALISVGDAIVEFCN